MKNWTCAVLLFATLFSIPAAAAPKSLKPATGDICELTRPLMGKTPKGKKILTKSTQVTLQDGDKKWTTVKAAGVEVQVNTVMLGKACKIVPPAPPLVEPVSASAAPPPPQPAAVPAPAAPPAPAGTPVAANTDTNRAANTVVITNFKAVGVSTTEAQLASAKVAEYLANASSYNVISMAELNAMAEYQKQMGAMGCDADACMAQLAKVANAGLAISGSVGKVGNDFVISISLINIEASKSVGAGTVNIASMDALDGALPKLCEQIANTGTGPSVHYSLPAGQKVSFAVFDLKGQGVSEDAARNLTQILAVEIKKVEGTTVVSRDDINAMLQMQQQKDALGCDSVGCLAEIGGALGVDNLIVGDVGKVADRYVVTLRLLDVRTSRALGRVNETFEGQEDQLLSAVRQAGRRLIGAESSDPGGLAIATNQQHATIFVDGDMAGASPLPPLKTLRAGKHSLRVSKDGYIDWRSDVFVEAANTTAVWCALDEAPQHWYQKWWVWTLVGGVAAVGAGAGIYFSQGAPSTGQGTAYLPQ